MKIKKGYRVLIFYRVSNVSVFTGSISAHSEDIEINISRVGRCSIYAYDTGNSLIQIVGTNTELEKIRGDN